MKYSSRYISFCFVPYSTLLLLLNLACIFCGGNISSLLRTNARTIEDIWFGPDTSSWKCLLAHVRLLVAYVVMTTHDKATCLVAESTLNGEVGSII